MNLATNKFIHYLPANNSAGDHYVVTVYTSEEVWGMVEISVEISSPESMFTKLSYHWFMFADKVKRMPEFKRFRLDVRNAVRLGVFVCLNLPHNKQFWETLDLTDLQNSWQISILSK